MIHSPQSLLSPSPLLLSIIPAALLRYLSVFKFNVHTLTSALPFILSLLPNTPSLFFFICLQPTFAQFPPSPCCPTAPKEVIVKLGSD